jgi:integrase
MPKIHLTERSISKLPAPASGGRQTLHWDTALSGFAVLCSGSSSLKSYVVQRDVGGKSRRVHIGSVAELPLIKARDRAREALDDLRQGIMPAVKADKNLSLRAAIEGLVQRPDLRPASVRAYRMPLRTLSSWADLPLRSISEDMIERRHRELGAAIGGHTANATMRALSAVWGYAVERVPDLPTCPVRRLKRQWFAEPRRERLVGDDKMADFYSAVMALENAVVRDCLLLIMFTGMRRGETISLRWEDVDLKERVIRLPATVTKNKKPATLPMSDLVFDLLVARRALGKDKFIFPGLGKAGYISDLQCAFNEIEQQTGVKISAHDLRRTFVTTAESIGISIGTSKALVNHTESDITMRYAVISKDRLRVATQTVTDRLKTLCGIKDPAGGNVKKLAQKIRVKETV